jgi:hypothetical protein
MKMMKNSTAYRFVFFVIALITSGICMAQATADSLPKQAVQMATGMRSSGKIYVVVAVLLTVISGLFIYVYRLDKKITKLEKGL